MFSTVRVRTLDIITDSSAFVYCLWEWAGSDRKIIFGGYFYRRKSSTTKNHGGELGEDFMTCTF